MALEYSFARRPIPGVQGAKDISHIWELGGGISVKDLVKVPLKRGLDKSVVVIVLDGSKPENVVPSLNKWMDIIRRSVEEEMLVFQASEPDRAKDMLDAASKRVDPSHPDYGLLKISPVPVLFVLNKFDTMKDMEPASRKCLLQAVRFVSHANGGAVVCGSNRDKVREGGPNLQKYTQITLLHIILLPTLARRALGTSTEELLVSSFSRVVPRPPSCLAATTSRPLTMIKLPSRLRTNPNLGGRADPTATALYQ